MRRWRLLVLAMLAATPAAAAPGAFQLEIDGVGKIGFVKSIEGGDEAHPLSVTFAEVTPSLSAFVAGFAEGKPVSRKLAFTNDVTIKRAREAQLLRVRLPAIGGGGSPDVALVFAASPLVSSPWLSAKAVAAPPPGKRIADARVDAGQGIRVRKISAVEIAQSAGKGVVREVTIEGEPGSLPAMAAWAKSKAARSLRVDYVDADVKTLIEIRLDGCTPRSFVPTPATLTLACSSIRS